jgi:hypothetical protein
VLDEHLFDGAPRLCLDVSPVRHHTGRELPWTAWARIGHAAKLQDA